MRTIAILWLCTLSATLVLVGACKKETPTEKQPPATTGKATTGEKLPSTVVNVTLSTAELDGKAVDTIANVERGTRVVIPKALVGAIDAKRAKGCVVRADHRASQLWVASVLEGIGTSASGGDVFLDTSRGVVRVSVAKATGRALAVLIDGDVKARLRWEEPVGEVSADPPSVEVPRNNEREDKAVELPGLSEKMAEAWKAHAAGAKHVLLRVGYSQEFRTFATVVREADEARRSLGESFTIVVASPADADTPVAPAPKDSGPDSKPHDAGAAALTKKAFELSEPKVISGELGPEAIQRSILKAYRGFEVCELTARKRDPDFEAEATITVSIPAAGGTTREVEVTTRPTGKDRFGGCLTRAMRRVTFPASDGLTKSEVTVRVRRPDGSTSSP